jgi:hypothetical protein
MRLLRSLLPVSIILMLSCSNNREKGKISIKDEKGKATATFDVKSIEELVKVAEKSGDKAEELKKLTPLSTDQLKAMMPEELMGIKKTSFSADSYSGASSSTATYKSDDGKELKLIIYDCAGEAGAGIYAIRYMTMWNIEHEDDHGYQKTVDFNGQKAVENYVKSSDEYSIAFLSNDRFLVTVAGVKTGLNFVKQAANSLNLKIN